MELLNENFKPAEKLMTANELVSLLNISHTTLWRHLDAGSLPRPLRLGNKRYWRYSEVVASMSNEK